MTKTVTKIKKYSSLVDFSKKRNTSLDDSNFHTFYQGYCEDAIIQGVLCYVIVAFFDNDGNRLTPESFNFFPNKVEYIFRFDPGTDEEFATYQKICKKYGNPDWICLS
jgi:hypothetical protein